MALAANKLDTLVTTYLEMTSELDFVPAFIRAADIEIVNMEMPDLGFYKFLYQSVGEEWAWRDRLQMTNSELREICLPMTRKCMCFTSADRQQVTSSCFVTPTAQWKSHILACGATIWGADLASIC